MIRLQKAQDMLPSRLLHRSWIQTRRLLLLLRLSLLDIILLLQVGLRLGSNLMTLASILTVSILQIR